jgi:hypothetical protein
MNTNSKLFADIYAACLDSVHEMGDDVKTMSWFGQRWHPNTKLAQNEDEDVAECVSERTS